MATKEKRPRPNPWRLAAGVAHLGVVRAADRGSVIGDAYYGSPLKKYIDAALKALDEWEATADHTYRDENWSLQVENNRLRERLAKIAKEAAVDEWV